MITELHNFHFWEKSVVPIPVICFYKKIGKWHTTARDFASTKDLILCKSGNVDLSEAVFEIEGGTGDYKAEDLIAQTGDGQTFSISGTETMKIEKK